MPKLVERCRTSASSSTNEPGSSSCSTRSRAVWRPLACWRAIAASLSASSAPRRCRSASLPAVVWMSGSSSSGDRLRRSAHGPEPIQRRGAPAWPTPRHARRRAFVPTSPHAGRRSPSARRRPSADGHRRRGDRAGSVTSMNVTAQPLDAGPCGPPLVGPWAQLDVVRAHRVHQRRPDGRRGRRRAGPHGARRRVPGGRPRPARPAAGSSPPGYRDHGERAAAPGRRAAVPVRLAAAARRAGACWTPCAGQLARPAGAEVAERRAARRAASARWPGSSPRWPTPHGPAVVDRDRAERRAPRRPTSRAPPRWPPRAPSRTATPCWSRCWPTWPSGRRAGGRPAATRSTPGCARTTAPACASLGLRGAGRAARRTAAHRDRRGRRPATAGCCCSTRPATGARCPRATSCTCARRLTRYRRPDVRRVAAARYGGVLVAYPDDLLVEGEQVVVHRHPHWKMLVVPGARAAARGRARQLPGRARRPPRAGRRGLARARRGRPGRWSAGSP